MNREPGITWTVANGFGLAFVVSLQIGVLVQYGIDFERHWQWQPVPPGEGLLDDVADLGLFLRAAALFGAAQALALRSKAVRAAPWTLATVASSDPQRDPASVGSGT